MAAVQPGSKRKHAFPAAMLIAAGLAATSTPGFTGGNDGGAEAPPQLGLGAVGMGLGGLSDGLAAEIGLATRGEDAVHSPGRHGR
jgi:hypothetical protein